MSSINPAWDSQGVSGYNKTANVPESDLPPHAQQSQPRKRRGRGKHGTGVSSKHCDDREADCPVEPGIADRSVASRRDRQVGQRLSQTPAPSEVSEVLTETSRASPQKEVAAASIGTEFPQGLTVGREAGDEESPIGSIDSVGNRDLWKVETRYPAGQHVKGAKPGNVDSILTASVGVTVVDVNGRRKSRKQPGTHAGKGRSRDDADYGIDTSSKTKLPPFVEEAGKISSIAPQDSPRRDDGGTVTTRADDGSTKETPLRPTDAETNKFSGVPSANSIGAAPPEARENRSIEDPSRAAENCQCDARVDLTLSDGSESSLGNEVRQRSKSSAVNRKSVIAVAVSKLLDPPPAPFRGTFWDEEDEYGMGQTKRRNGAAEDLERPEGTRPVASRRKPRIHVQYALGDRQHDIPGHRKTSLADKEDLTGENNSNQGSWVPTALRKVDGFSRNQDDKEEAMRGQRGRVSVSSGSEKEDGAMLDVTLSDGGLGKRALSCHTKTEENRRHFFEVYRRMARQVCQLMQTSSGFLF